MIPLRSSLLLVAVVLLMSGCRKGGCNVIDEIIVSETFLFGEFPQLRIPGGYAEVDATRGGIAGIIVLNAGNNRYVAYDRASTVNPAKRCAVNVQEGGLIAIDPCSQAKWILTNGSPAEIAECPLKPYRVRLQSGGSAVIVSN